MVLFSVFSKAETIVLDEVSNLDFHQATRDLLIAAHASIGNEVVFVKVPLARSYQEIQKGLLSGFVCRIQNAHSSQPNIVRVPESVGSFNVVLVVDTSQCNGCTSLNDLHHVVSVQGFKALEKYLEQSASNNDNISYLASREQVIEMLSKGRVDGIIISDVLLTDSLLEAHPHWQVVALQKEELYHYLHSDYEFMVDELAFHIKRLKQTL